MSDTPDRPAAGQVWDAAGYARDAGFVADLGAPLVELLAPRPGERVLDLGCGDGRLTLRLAEGGAEVTGLEPDPSLAAAARGRGIAVLARDAHEPFGAGTYDAVFSNAALHWMRDPALVLANVHAALRPGGRLVAEQGGFGNVAAIVTAVGAAVEAAIGRAGLPAVWDFPTPARQAARLAAAGFVEIDCRLIPRPTPLPAGMRAWLDTFARPLLADVPPARHGAVLDDAVRRLGALHDPEGGWVADYVRLRLRARKPG